MLSGSSCSCFLACAYSALSQPPLVNCVHLSDFSGHLVFDLASCSLKCHNFPLLPHLSPTTPGVVCLPSLSLVTPRVDLFSCASPSSSHRSRLTCQSVSVLVLNLFSPLSHISLRSQFLLQHSIPKTLLTKGFWLNLRGNQTRASSQDSLRVRRSMSKWRDQSSLNLSTRWSFDPIPPAYLTQSLPNPRI